MCTGTVNNIKKSQLIILQKNFTYSMSGPHIYLELTQDISMLITDKLNIFLKNLS